MEDLAKKLDRFDAALTSVLDKLSGLEAWKSTANASMDKLLAQSEQTTSRIHRLETLPPPPPPPPPMPPRPAIAPPQPHPNGINPFNLNSAPLQEVCPSAPTWERPSGHRVANHHRNVGGGILGFHPPHPVTGTSHGPSPQSHGLDAESLDSSTRPCPIPKLKFPKFDGDNPRLWKDRCEMYFEVYRVSESLKPRFAALNFSGPAATWLQTLELRGRVSSWEALCSAVCERFDKY